MKIRRLLLKAFGPFTEVELDLNAPTGAVNVVFGENEAGKSSALRALEAFCFGFEARSQDDHIHNYSQLRVGAILELQNGQQGAFIRRKANKKSLTDLTGTIIEDEAFEKFLCGVGQTGFEALFCLSYQRLNEGSKSILAENGELGKLLFEARSDLSLRTIQTSLAKRTDDLFKGNSRANTTIDKTLLEYDAHKKTLKKGDFADYRDVQAKLVELEKTKQEIETKRATLRAEQARLNRIQTAIPLVRRLKRAQHALQERGDLPELPPAFIKDYEEVLQAHRTAKTQLENAEQQVGSLQRRLLEISPNAEVLRWRAEIDRLNTHVGQIAKHLEDMPDEEKKAARFLSESRSALATIRPGEEPVEAELNIGLARERISNLIKEKRRLDQDLTNAQTQIDNIQTTLATAKRRLEATAKIQLPPTLTTALRTAQAIQDAAAKQPAKIKEEQALRLQCEQTASRLGAAGRSPLEFTSLPVPNKTTLRAAQDYIGTLDGEINRLTNDLHDAQAKEISVRAERQALLQGKAILTEINLKGARDSRDLQWQDLKKKVASPAIILEAQLTDFEQSIADADHIADRLRQDADDTAKMLTLDNKLIEAAQEVEAKTKALNKAQEAKQAAEEAWKARWQPLSIAPELPREMADWLESFDQLAKDARSLVVLQQDIKETTAAIQTATANLETALAEPPQATPLPDLIAKANQLQQQSLQVAGSIENYQTQIQENEPALAAAQTVLAQVQQKQTDWQSAWATETACLKLPRTPTPDEAEAAIAAIADSLAKWNIAQIAEKRVKGMQTDIQNFEEKANKVIEAAAPDLQQLPPLAAIQNLYRTLRQAEQQETQQHTLQNQLNEQNLAKETANQQLDKATNRLAALAQQAGCQKPEDLESLVKQSAEAARLRAEAEEAIKDLQAPTPEFIATVESQDEFTLQTQLEDIEKAIASQSNDLETTNQQIGIETANQKALDKDNAQVETQLLAEAALAKVRSAVRPYLVYATAESLIRAQIEEYRRANQGPILKKAGEIFSVLTNGSFSELTGELDEKDQPVLIGVRKNRVTGAEERLKVEAMSAATRIGLYLSLRLACVYHHVDQREGLPFVADDILLDFDDARARRVMEELGRLAEKTQVILFTHHKHLVEIGQDVLGDKCLVQNLTRP